MEITTLSVTGRPTHHSHIHLDQQFRPCSAECECGCRWTPDDSRWRSVSEWGFVHVAPEAGR
jgi:hypothetical protein